MPDTPIVTRLVVNARIRTGDPRRPWADAAALAGDRVVAVGSSAELRKRVAPDIPRENAGGAPMRLDGERLTRDDA